MRRHLLLIIHWYLTSWLRKLVLLHVFIIRFSVMLNLNSVFTENLKMKHVFFFARVLFSTQVQVPGDSASLLIKSTLIHPGAIQSINVCVITTYFWHQNNIQKLQTAYYHPVCLLHFVHYTTPHSTLSYRITQTTMLTAHPRLKCTSYFCQPDNVHRENLLWKTSFQSYMDSLCLSYAG